MRTISYIHLNVNEYRSIRASSSAVRTNFKELELVSGNNSRKESTRRKKNAIQLFEIYNYVAYVRNEKKNEAFSNVQVIHSSLFVWSGMGNGIEYEQKAL